MNTVVSALDRFYAHHPIAAMVAMILVAFGCMVAIAALGQGAML